LNKTRIKVSSCEEADLDLGVPSRDWLPARHSSETIKTLNDGPLDGPPWSKAEVLASQGDVNFGSHSGHCSTRSARGKHFSAAEPQIRRLQGMLVEPIRLFCPTGKSLRVLPVCLSSPICKNISVLA